LERLISRKLIMADHLFVFRGHRAVWAIALAILSLALLQPAGAQASGSLIQLPAAAQGAIDTALAQAYVPTVSVVSGTTVSVTVSPAPAAPPVVAPPAPAPASAVLPPNPPAVPSAPTGVPSIPLRSPAQVAPTVPAGVAQQIAGTKPAGAGGPVVVQPTPPAVVRRAAHPVARPDGRTARRSVTRASAPAPRTGPVGAPRVSATFPAETALAAQARHGSGPAVRAHRGAARDPVLRTHRLQRPASGPSSVAAGQWGPPVSASPPPGGAEGAATGGGGSAAGAATAALLALVGVGLLRALLPGLLALRRRPLRSALVVSALEHPG
jgi:hypothetical protein